MWKARAPARTEMSSQNCKVQGMTQKRRLPQGMPVQEKRQESQSCPDTTQDEDNTHIDKNGVREPNPPRVNMPKIAKLYWSQQGTTRKTPYISNHHTPQGTLQAPSSGQSGHRS